MTKDNGRLDLILSALSNEARRTVITSLAYNPSTPSALAKEAGISLPGMHKHLTILEAADLIRRQKVGRVNFVALNPDTLQEAQSWLATFQTHWGTRRESLENYISRFDSSEGE